MGAYCTAARCRNAHKKGYIMVRYPQDEARRKLWLKNMGRPDWTPHPGARICAAHFTSDQWVKEVKVDRLKENAVPTLVCTCPDNKMVIPGRTAHLLEHSYASVPVFYSSKCLAHRVRKARSVEQELKENCRLKTEVELLQRTLKEKDALVKEHERFVSALPSIENVQRDSTPRRFSTQDIKKGVEKRFACGSSGYSKLKEEQDNLPNIRTLQRHTQHIKMSPGLQDIIFDALALKVAGLTDPRDKDVCFLFDEAAIKKSIEYDNSTGEWIGYCTLPGKGEGIASKAEVYVVGGCHRPLKQVVGYHLTLTESACVNQKKTVILDMFSRAKTLGLNVIAIVCDMGNRGLLTELGFSFKKDDLRFSIASPVDSSERVFCFPDVVHLFKSVKEMLANNKTIKLSEDIVQKHNLPSSTVCFEHIEWLESYQRSEELKFVPRLKLRDLNCGHFRKMKVSSAHNVLNHRTASALNYLSEKGVAPAESKTTAWFINLVNRWFDLLTARTPQFALGFKNMIAYQNALEHLKLVIAVFESFVTGGAWKPVHSHVILATHAALEIQHYLLHVKGYQFVMFGRMSQDLVENIFSLIRMHWKNLTALQFKMRLKQLIISQFSMKIDSSSYEYSEAADFIDLLFSVPPEQPIKDTVNILKFKWLPNVPANAGKPTRRIRLEIEHPV